MPTTFETAASRDAAVSPPAQAAVELDAVTKRFGDFTAVDNLTLRIEHGEIFGLLGPNGSGKTTTINMVSGLSRPTSGTVHVLGTDIAHQARAVRARIGAMPQETALYEELTAWANMAFHADLYGVPRRERDHRITALLDLVQLSDRRNSRVGSFSGGMKRRLALARALLHDPQLVYLDEPTLGVDVQSRRALWNYILGLKAQGKTVLITTNYLEEASALCDRLAILDHGKLVALDTPDALRRRFGDTIVDLETAQPATAALVQQLRSMSGVREVTQDGTRLKVSVDGEQNVTGQVVTLVTQETALRGIAQREPNLDEVFLHLTGSALRD